ncbi:MAG TPA: endonuclease/exonuclease/phosphatase family protein, partial [Polyangiaceae bacterium]
MRSLAAFGVLALVGCGQAPLSPRDPTPGAVHFTIQSYNVAADHFGDAPTLETVGYANADIVCLQETADEWKPVLKDRYSDQYPHMLFHATGGAGGLTVLSKFPLEDEGIIPAPNASQPDWHPAWALRVETP